MKLEDELKQKGFNTPHHRMAVNIMFTGNWVSKDLTCRLKKYGVSLQQHNVLSILKGQYPNPAPLGLIQERMLDKDSNATRLVDKLLQKDLVSRCQCAENRRKVDILITKKGLALLEKIADEMEGFETRFKNINEAEATLLAELLDKVRE